MCCLGHGHGSCSYAAQDSAARRAGRWAHLSQVGHGRDVVVVHGQSAVRQLHAEPGVALHLLHVSSLRAGLGEPLGPESPTNGETSASNMLQGCVL